MEFRKRISSRSAVTLSGLLIFNIVIAFLYFGIRAIVFAGNDCGTEQPTDVQRSDEETKIIGFIIYFPILLEAVSTLLFIGTRYVSMAIFGIVCALLTPSIYLVIGGPNIAIIFFIALPIFMLFHARYWEYETGERKTVNPLHFPVREDILDR